MAIQVAEEDLAAGISRLAAEEAAAKAKAAAALEAELAAAESAAAEVAAGHQAAMENVAKAMELLAAEEKADLEQQAAERADAAKKEEATRAAARLVAEQAAAAPPDPRTVGTLRVRLSHAAGIDAEQVFVKLGVGGQRQVSKATALKTAPRWDADFVFRGKYGELAAEPMVVSGWEIDSASQQVGLLGEGRIDLGALVTTMQGMDCGVPVGDGQVVL